MWHGHLLSDLQWRNKPHMKQVFAASIKSVFRKNPLFPKRDVSSVSTSSKVTFLVLEFILEYSTDKFSGDYFLHLHSRWRFSKVRQTKYRMTRRLPLSTPCRPMQSLWKRPERKDKEMFISTFQSQGRTLKGRGWHWMILTRWRSSMWVEQREKGLPVPSVNPYYVIVDSKQDSTHLLT